jgi:hypothetical protein
MRKITTSEISESIRKGLMLGWMMIKKLDLFTSQKWVGEVNDWGEYNLAEIKAYEGGAKDVQIELTVIYPFYSPQNQYPFWPYPLYK